MDMFHPNRKIVPSSPSIDIKVKLIDLLAISLACPCVGGHVQLNVHNFYFPPQDRIFSFYTTKKRGQRRQKDLSNN